MQSDSLYLDYAATAPVSSIIQRNMYDSFDYFGNPATFYKEGEIAYQALTKGKANILMNLGHNEEWDMIFTSGATESINTVFNCYKPDIVFTTDTEHEATVENLKDLNVVNIPIDINDYYSEELNEEKLNKLIKNLKVRKTKNMKILISVIGVNNETGIVFHTEYFDKIKIAIRKRYSNAEILIHVDFTQGFCKVPFDMSEVDCYSFSGHKIGFFKGFGGLVFKKQTFGEYLKENPFIKGGGQQNKLRSGTENAQFVYLFDKLVEDQMKNLDERYMKAKMIREAFCLGIRNVLDNIKMGYRISSYELNELPRGLEGMKDQIILSPYIIRLSFNNIEGESIVSALAEENISISTGSACSSDSLLGSKVIYNYFKNKDGNIYNENDLQRWANGTIRISFDHTLTIDQISTFLAKFKKVIELLIRTSAPYKPWYEEINEIKLDEE